jgi:hypothetical protein
MVIFHDRGATSIVYVLTPMFTLQSSRERLSRYKRVKFFASFWSKSKQILTRRGSSTGTLSIHIPRPARPGMASSVVINSKAEACSGRILVYKILWIDAIVMQPSRVKATRLPSFTAAEKSGADAPRVRCGSIEEELLKASTWRDARRPAPSLSLLAPVDSSRLPPHICPGLEAPTLDC